MYSNPQTVCASVALVMPKGGPFLLVVDHRAVNQQLEAVSWPHPNLEQAAEFFVGASYFVTLDLLQRFWPMPMDEESEECFTIVPQKGDFPHDEFRRSY